MLASGCPIFYFNFFICLGGGGYIWHSFVWWNACSLSDQHICPVLFQSQDHTSFSSGSIPCQRVKLPDNLWNKNRGYKIKWCYVRKQDSEHGSLFLPSKIIGEKVLLILPISKILCMQLHTNNTFPFHLVYYFEFENKSPPQGHIYTEKPDVICNPVNVI